MSIPTVIKDIQLISTHLFDHTPLVRTEIDRFVERFEKNQRHREFDGILRASHALIEAAETPVEALFDTGKMVSLTNEIDAVTARIKQMLQPTYQQEHEDYLKEIATTQKAYLDLCRTEAQKKMRGANEAQRH